LNPANGASRPEESGVRRWIVCLLAVFLLAAAAPMIWWHTRQQPAGQTPAGRVAGNLAAATAPSSPPQTERPSPAAATAVPTNDPMMAQTNLAVSPMTNAPAAENPAEQSLRDRIQELEERIRKLEEALAATKAPPTKPGANDSPYPPTPVNIRYGSVLGITYFPSSGA